MKNFGIISNTKKTAKQLAIDAAKKTALEPVEILKTARTQVTGIETGKMDKPQGAGIPTEPPDNGQKAPDESKVKQKDLRIVTALDAEMEEIRKTRDEREQREKAEEEARQTATLERTAKASPQSSSKRPKGMLGAWKRKISQMLTKHETRQTPSG